MLRVAVFATIPKGVFSGGRYHALMVAEVLARLGHEAWFITNNPPVFAEDLAPIAPDDPVRIVLTDDFNVSPAVPFDAVFVAPQMTPFPQFYESAVRFAREAGAGLVLINYESPNWFNAFSPHPRPEENWREWRSFAAEGALVLSSAHESRKFAEAYYTALPPESAFDVWQPAINSVACSAVPDQPRERLIVLFSRPSDAHKGGGDISDLIGPELSGHTIGLIIGNPRQAERFVEELRVKGEPHGVGVEPYFALSDSEKFRLLKRAAAVVFPSYFEGYGYPPLEALACDTPCVAYDLPVVRENCGDLVRYAPLGDVAALRRELVAALRAGPTATSRDPRVVELTDVDARGRALERVIVDHVAHLKRVRTAAFEPKAADFRLTPASVVHVRRRPQVVFALSAPRVIEAIEDLPAFVTAAQVLRGAWDGRGWRHDVVLTLADKASLARLKTLTPTLRFGCGRLRLPLADLTIRRWPIPDLAADAAAVTKASDAAGRSILEGWVYPSRAYDGLLAMDEAGTIVRLDTAQKNLHYRKSNPVDPREFCGFASPVLDRDRFDVDRLRLFVLDRGRVVAKGRLDARKAMSSASALRLVGDDTGGDRPAGRAEPAAPLPDLGTVRAALGRPETHALAAPLVAPPSALRLLIGRTRNRLARRFGWKAIADASAPTFRITALPGLKWALSESAYDPDTGELILRGWTNMPDRLRIEVWGDARVAGTVVREERPDIARVLGASDRDDFGFCFRGGFDRSADQKVDVRLMNGADCVARKVVDGADLSEVVRVKVDDLLWDPQWNLLWMRGTYDAPGSEPIELRLCRGDDTLATAAIDRKFRPDGNIFFRWRIEETVDTGPIAGEKLHLVATDAAGVTRRIAWMVPSKQKWLDGIAGPNDDLRLAEYGAPLSAEAPAPKTPSPLDVRRKVLLVAHNLDAIERGEKREALMRLRRELNAREVELIVLHHAPRPIGCALPEINFFGEPLELAARGAAALGAGLDPSDRSAEAGGGPVRPSIDERTMDYARRMLYGFVFALNRRPKSWSDIEKQTADEAAKLDVAIRLVEPSVVLLWHQWNSLTVIARAIADRRGIPSAIIHEGMLPGTMTLDRRGMMAESDATGEMLADTAENAPYFARARAVIDEIRARELDRKPQAGTPGALQALERLRRRDPGLRTVFYAGVNDWQSGNLPADHPRAGIHSPVYKDTMAGLAALLEVAERQDFVVLFKPHPNLFPRPLDLRHERLIHVREASATDCIAATDVTATLLSSLAYISLAHGKPTVLLGRNTLSGCHAAYESSDHASLDACLAAALAATDEPEHRQRFVAHVAALLKTRLFPYGDATGFSMRSEGDAADEIIRIIEEGRIDHSEK